MLSPSIFSRSSQFGRCAVWISLFAIALRAMVPVGWMPGASEGTTIVICTAQGLTEIVLGPDAASGETQEHQDGNLDPGPCVFAATAHFFVPASPGIPLPSDSNVGALSLAEAQIPASGFAARLPQVRAPPTLS